MKTNKKLSATKRCERYVKNVLSNKIKACEWVKLACQRHARDLAKPPTYVDRDDRNRKKKYIYDVKRANHAARFIEALTQPSGNWANNNFILEDFQCFIICSIFGWVNQKGYRRFNIAYLSMARKNGKSALCAAIALYGLFADGEKNAKIKIAALDKSQAQIIVEYCETLIQDNKFLKEFYSPKCLGGSPPRRIRYPKTQSDLQPMSKEQGQHDGHSISHAIIDEYHAHKTDRMSQVIETSFGSRTQPLCVYITTAGFDLSAPCLQKENYMKTILTGDSKSEQTFCCIWTLPDGSDWKDPKNWIYANPNLGVSTFTERLERVRDEALIVPETRLNFLVKNCNTWQSSIMGWMNMNKYDDCYEDPKEWDFTEDTKGNPVVVGVDLSERSDLTALSIVCQFEGRWCVRSHYFIPQDTAQLDVRYSNWEQAGWCTIVRQSSIEFEDIQNYINNIHQDYPVEAVVLDPSLGRDFKNALNEDGFMTVDYRQRVSYMSPALKSVHHEIMNVRYAHDGNPISRMCFENAMVTKQDDGSIKLKKASPSAKNDGVVATAVAFGHLIYNEKPVVQRFGVYDEETGQMVYID